MTNVRNVQADFSSVQGFFWTGRSKTEYFGQPTIDGSDVFVNAFLVKLMPPPGFQHWGFKFTIVYPPEYA